MIRAIFTLSMQLLDCSSLWVGMSIGILLSDFRLTLACMFKVPLNRVRTSFLSERCFLIQLIQIAHSPIVPHEYLSLSISITNTLSKTINHQRDDLLHFSVIGYFTTVGNLFIKNNFPFAIKSVKIF